MSSPLPSSPPRTAPRSQTPSFIAGTTVENTPIQQCTAGTVVSTIPFLTGTTVENTPIRLGTTHNVISDPLISSGAVLEGQENISDMLSISSSPDELGNDSVVELPTLVADSISREQSVVDGSVEIPDSETFDNDEFSSSLFDAVLGRLGVDHGHGEVSDREFKRNDIGAEDAEPQDDSVVIQEGGVHEREESSREVMAEIPNTEGIFDELESPIQNPVGTEELLEGEPGDTAYQEKLQPRISKETAGVEEEIEVIPSTVAPGDQHEYLKQNTSHLTQYTTATTELLAEPSATITAQPHFDTHSLPSLSSGNKISTAPKEELNTIDENLGAESFPLQDTTAVEPPPGESDTIMEDVTYTVDNQDLLNSPSYISNHPQNPSIAADTFSSASKSQSSALLRDEDATKASTLPEKLSSPTQIITPHPSPGKHNSVPGYKPSAATDGSASPNKDQLLKAELKAIKIASIQARSTSLESEIARIREKTQDITKHLTAPASETVKSHIKLLHDYNDIRDVGQSLIGMIADNRGVRVGELYQEFGVELKD